MSKVIGEGHKHHMEPDRTPIKQTLADEEKKELRVALRALDALTAENPTVPAQALRVFLLVALEEGLSMSQYQAQSGLSQSVTSRYLLDIGDRNRYMEQGFGWITSRMDPLNRRRHQAMLTNKGRALAHRVIRVIQKG